MLLPLLLLLCCVCRSGLSDPVFRQTLNVSALLQQLDQGGAGKQQQEDDLWVVVKAVVDQVGPHTPPGPAPSFVFPSLSCPPRCLCVSLWWVVHQAWAVNEQAHPSVPPQSHVVNARTNPNW